MMVDQFVFVTENFHRVKCSMDVSLGFPIFTSCFQNLIIIFINLFIIGIWSLINTTGICHRGRLEQQDITHWDSMLKINVVGALRLARTYQGLLSNARGRSLTIGAPLANASGTLVAYSASKHGAEGAALAMRQEMASFGVDVVVVNFENLPPDLMLAAPAIKK